MKKSITLALLIIILSYAEYSRIFCQGTVEDYKRADSLQYKFNNKVYYGDVRPTWVGESNLFTYENITPQGIQYILADPVKKRKEEAFNMDRFTAALSKMVNRKIDSENLPIKSVKFKEDLKSFTFLLDNVEWTCHLPSYRMVKGETSNESNRPNNTWPWGFRDETKNDPVESPDKRFTAYIKNYNLYIKDEEGNETQLSFDGGIGMYYSSYIHWSPNSKKIMAYKVQPAEKHMINYIESSPSDQIQPKSYSYEYPKPGDAIPQFFPQIFDIETMKHIKVDGYIYRNQYSLGRFDWRDDSNAITFEYNQRGHQVYQVIYLDAHTGEQQVLIDERSDTFIHYSGKRYRFDINDQQEIIWASERDGWNHLYLYDGISGKMKNQITKGEWVVRGVEFVDTLKKKIIFTASGREGGDPYFIYYYSINFNGTGLRILTPEMGNHIAIFSPDKKFFVDTWSTISIAPTTVLRETASGTIVMELEKADITALTDQGWKAPEEFVSKGRDGTTDIYGILIRPTNYDPLKKYPVIEYIYAGPHSSFVPKSFRPFIAHMHPLAEIGFIVVQIDGMGTSNRSKAFHDVCYKNLKDAGLPDRILWIKDAALKDPSMDITNVGIYGTSAGGQSSTGALLFYPEFYKVAVSSCGCHDNRMDKIWWNEQWMGWPVGPEYRECSNVDNAYRLQGKLLLINGEMDNNVDPTSTMQVLDALIKANKDVDYLFVPGMKHSSGGDYGEHKRRDFFVKNLLGVDPPSWSQIQ